jgi:hypothetical protein
VLLLIASLLVGPVESWSLWKLNHPGRRWTTTLGWLGMLVAGGALAIGGPASPPIPTRGLRVIDQVDDHVVGSSRVVSMSSQLFGDSIGWWRPMGAPANSNEHGTPAIVPFHQAQDSSSPIPDRFASAHPLHLRCDQLAPAPAVIRASLAIDTASADGRPRLFGTIANPGPVTLARVLVHSSVAGDFAIDKPIAPGQTVDVRQSAQVPTVDDVDMRMRADEIGSARTQRFGRAGDLAIVYGKLSGDPAADVDAETIVRALIVLRQAEGRQ